MLMVRAVRTYIKLNIKTLLFIINKNKIKHIIKNISIFEKVISKIMCEPKIKTHLTIFLGIDFSNSDYCYTSLPKMEGSFYANHIKNLIKVKNYNIKTTIFISVIYLKKFEMLNDNFYKNKHYFIIKIKIINNYHLTIAF